MQTGRAGSTFMLEVFTPLKGTRSEMSSNLRHKVSGAREGEGVISALTCLKLVGWKKAGAAWHWQISLFLVCNDACFVQSIGSESSPLGTRAMNCSSLALARRYPENEPRIHLHILVSIQSCHNHLLRTQSPTEGPPHKTKMVMQKPQFGQPSRSVRRNCPQETLVLDSSIPWGLLNSSGAPQIPPVEKSNKLKADF
eukprot:216745-Hanusia_phi.AAC.3